MPGTVPTGRTNNAAQRGYGVSIFEDIRKPSGPGQHALGDPA